jgi:hypothetical protein
VSAIRSIAWLVDLDISSARASFGGFSRFHDLPKRDRLRQAPRVDRPVDGRECVVNPQEQLTELERLANELEVEVCYEPMGGLVQGIGGLCRVKGRYRIIVDRKLKAPERLQVVADALRRFDTEKHFVSPQVRKLLA